MLNDVSAWYVALGTRLVLVVAIVAYMAWVSSEREDAAGRRYRVTLLGVLGGAGISLFRNIFVGLGIVLLLGAMLFAVVGALNGALTLGGYFSIDAMAFGEREQGAAVAPVIGAIMLSGVGLLFTYAALVYCWHRTLLHDVALQAGIRVGRGSYWSILAVILIMIVCVVVVAMLAGIAAGIVASVLSPFIENEIALQIGNTTLAFAIEMVVLYFLAPLSMTFPARSIGDPRSLGDVVSHAGPMIAVLWAALLCANVISEVLIYGGGVLSDMASAQLAMPAAWRFLALASIQFIATALGVLYAVAIVSEAYKRWVIAPARP